MTMSDVSDAVNKFKHHDVREDGGSGGNAGDRYKWWDEARFGMFIHWGIYAILGRGEWVMHRERMPKAEYAKLADQFFPKKGCADEWADLAVESGMKYIYLTTRHHDGFSLWDSKVSDFTSVKAPVNRDLVAEFVEACRKRDLKVGLYYSMMDWRIPAYWEGPYKDPAAWDEYRDYVHEQVRELMTNYGKIDLIWWDAAIPHTDEEWKWDELVAMIRSHQPNVIMNHDDFNSTEGDVVGTERPWEASVTVDDIWWGYHAGDPNIKSGMELTRHLVRCIVGIGGAAGHFTINIGPKGDGSVPAEQAKPLREVGKWLAKNGDSVYGANNSPIWPLHLGWGASSKGNTLYVHVMFWPGKEMWVAGIKNKVLRTYILATGEELPFEQKEDRLLISGLPAKSPDPVDTVVAVELDGPPEAVPEKFWKD